MAEAIFRHELVARNQNGEVRSAGFLTEGQSAHKNADWALRRLGLDVSAHVSAKVISVLGERPDLILTMTREHLRSLSRMTVDFADRTFTLKEFVRLGEIEGARHLAEPLSEYLARVGAGRTLSATTSLGSEFDVEDPIGRNRRAFGRCASELQGLVHQVAELLYLSVA